MKYYILTMDGNFVPQSFDTALEAEEYGINGGWNKFIIMKSVKTVKVQKITSEHMYKLPN